MDTVPMRVPAAGAGAAGARRGQEGCGCGCGCGGISESLIRVTYPTHLSESLIRVTYPSHLSESRRAQQRQMLPASARAHRLPGGHSQPRTRASPGARRLRGASRSHGDAVRRFGTPCLDGAGRGAAALSWRPQMTLCRHHRPL